MCRHLAVLSAEPVTLAQALLDPPYGLLRQSFAPRRQRHGTVNADGYGVGWYADGRDTPARWRRAVPMWTDRNLDSVAPVVATRCLLAAVRSTVPAYPVEETATAPFSAGRWLFSHNGSVPGYGDPASGVAAGLLALLPGAQGAAMESRVDSAAVWALTLARLRAGAGPGAALAGAVADVHSVTAARLNLLLTDGRMLAGTACGDTLWSRATPGRVDLASEPSDDGPGWVEVPDGSLVTATLAGPTTVPLT